MLGDGTISQYTISEGSLAVASDPPAEGSGTLSGAVDADGRPGVQRLGCVHAHNRHDADAGGELSIES